MESKNTFQKDCLLDLINNCIRNRAFYEKVGYHTQTLNPNTERIVSNGYVSCNKSHNTIRLKNYEDWAKKPESEVFSKIVKSLGKVEQVSFNNGIQIFFLDEPSINIYLHDDRVIKTIEEIEINEVNYVHKKSFWSDKIEKKEIITGNKLMYIKEENLPNIKYRIHSGSIIETITVEEFDKVYKLYETSKEKFEQEILVDENKKDLNKILERFHKYKK